MSCSTSPGSGEAALGQAALHGGRGARSEAGLRLTQGLVAPYSLWGFATPLMQLHPNAAHPQ